MVTNAVARYTAAMSKTRILVVKLSSLGDILHVMPTVQALHEQLGAEIHWAVQPEYHDLVACLSAVTRIIDIPRHRWWSGMGAAIASLRSERYDLVIDLQGLLKSATTARLARASRRIGPSYAREGAGWLYGERAGPVNRNRHAVDQAMDLLDHLGLHRPSSAAVDLTHPVVTPPQPAPRVALLPQSRWESKNWPLRHFVRLARLLVDRSDVHIMVLGGKSDSAAGDLIAQTAPERVINACGRYSLPELFSLLEQCDLLVANDTGPVHMAAALGKPCLVLFGPTRAERTGPYGAKHVIMTHEVPCRPCLSRRCCVPGHPCLARITPEAVCVRALEMLK